MGQKLVIRNGKPTGTDLYRKLSEQSDALDRLCRETSGGIRDQRHYDALESQAQDISKQLLAVFRGPRS